MEHNPNHLIDYMNKSNSNIIKDNDNTVQSNILKEKRCEMMKNKLKICLNNDYGNSKNSIYCLNLMTTILENCDN